MWLVGRSSHRFALALLPAAVLGISGVAGRIWAETLFAGSDIPRDHAEFGSNGIAVLSRSLLAIGDSFALGMVVAVLFVWIERGELAWWTRRRATTTGWSLVVVGSLGGLLLKDDHLWLMGTATSLAAAGVILLIVDPSARHEPSMLVRAAGWRPVEYTGEISLSFYLWHYPVIVVMSRTGLFGTDSLPSLLGSIFAVAGISFALASLTFKWVERPAMTGRWPRLGARKMFTFARRFRHSAESGGHG